jgi:ribosome maturation factor RimP
MSIVTERVAKTVEPLLAPLGLELFDVEHHGALLRVVVERAEGQIDMEGLEQATRLVSRALDAEDPVPGRYTLEVSSPGLERPLRTPGHFARAVGSDISLKLSAAVGEEADGPRRLRAKVVAADDTTVTVMTDGGEELSLPYERIVKARTIFEWGPTPKPGGPRAPRVKEEQ